MFAGIACLLIFAAFFLQLLLCFRAGRRVFRLLPVMAILLGELFCIVAYTAALWLEQTGDGIYGAAFAVFLYSIILFAALTGTAAAWLCWFLVKLVQKCRK